jgi:dUTP pyrophosphatase
MPKQATPESAGADLCASESLTLYPSEIRLVHTGLQMDIPKGYHIEVRSRSGLALKAGIFVLNSPGTVDSDYTGEIGVILCNAGKEPFHIYDGDRIAQMVVIHHEVPSFTLVKEILGEEWLNNEWFRFGASRLANNLLSSIVGKETKHF